MKILLIIWFALLAWVTVWTAAKVSVGAYPRVKFEPVSHAWLQVAVGLVFMAIIGAVLWI